ncbi:MAG TPA: cytochrome c peroxidase, partial [Woeseiaceae bacterium]|nr:cytochrome c peroxidase [Woeseiaceae bacterium]
MARPVYRLAFALLALGAAGALAWQRYAPPSPWTAAERELIASLWLAHLPEPPADATNAVAEDPGAVALGHRLFFDQRLSANGLISCGHCHQPERRFADGLPRAAGLGRTDRNTPSIVGAAYSPWLYWDGRKDSQWSQALAPLEAPREHGSSREAIAALIRNDAAYRREYAALFGPPAAASDERIFVNAGKAIAAYERRLKPGTSRFDRYVAHLDAGGDSRRQALLDERELRGLRLFIGAARCIECHNGPLFTNNEFHNTGLLSPPGETPDRGRADGLRALRDDPFNCAGEYSDDPARVCPELAYARNGPELIGATRTPSLRNIDGTAPFQSKGQFETLAEVLAHYNEAPPAMIGHNDTEPLGLSRRDLADIEAFLGSLAAP